MRALFSGAKNSVGEIVPAKVEKACYQIKEDRLLLQPFPSPYAKV